MSHPQVPDRDLLRSLDQMRRALEHEFHPLTPTEGALVLQMAATMIRLETLIPRALLGNDPKLLRELTQLQEHHQKTIRLLLRLQTQRRKATAPAPQAAKPAPINHPKPIAVPPQPPAVAASVSTHAPPHR